MKNYLSFLLGIILLAPSTSWAVFRSPQGIYALTSAQTTSSNPSFSTPASGITSYNGIAARAFWSVLEPSEGTYNWSYFDTLLSLAQANGKSLTLSVTCGQSSPAWVLSQVATFSFTYAGGVSIVPDPHDAIYRSKLSDFLTAMAARYGSNTTVTGVTMSMGPQIESFWIQNSTDYATFTSSSSFANWTAGQEAIIDLYCQKFPNVACIFSIGEVVTGSGPTSNSVGAAALTNVLNYGLSYYQNFGVANHGLSNTSDTSSSSDSARNAVIAANANAHPCGFQTTAAMGSNLGATITAAETILGSNDGFLEVYAFTGSNDMTSGNTSILAVANTVLSSVFLLGPSTPPVMAAWREALRIFRQHEGRGNNEISNLSMITK